MWPPAAVWMADGVMHKMRIISKLTSSARLFKMMMMMMTITMAMMTIDKSSSSISF